MSTTVVYWQFVKILYLVEDVITLDEEGSIIKIETYIDDIVTLDDQSTQYANDNSNIINVEPSFDGDGNIMREPSSINEFSSIEDNLESEWWVSFFISNTAREIRYHLRGVASS